MNPLPIPGRTHILTGVPEHGVSDIQVRQFRDVFMTRWSPTPSELAALNAGGSVLLFVKGSQPPVTLKVTSYTDPVP